MPFIGSWTLKLRSDTAQCASELKSLPAKRPGEAKKGSPDKQEPHVDH